MNEIKSPCPIKLEKNLFNNPAFRENQDRRILHLRVISKRVDLNEGVFALLIPRSVPPFDKLRAGSRKGPRVLGMGGKRV